MLDVETNHQVILLNFKEGLSQRKIAQQLKISRKTAKARVAEYERFKSQSASEDPAAVSATTKYLTEGPAYDISNRTKRKLIQEIADIIESCPQENEIKRLDGRKKAAITQNRPSRATPYSRLLYRLYPSVNTSEQGVLKQVKHLSNRVMDKVLFASLIGEKLK